jgi:hypothetical protein
VVRDGPNTYQPPTRQEAFDRLSEEEQDATYGPERAAAIRGGAPLARFATVDHGYLTAATQEDAGA